MIFHQYVLGCLSQMSYFIGDETSGRAVVVDPRRDVGAYLTHAAAAGVRIERVIETHCHADFLSGHRICCRRPDIPARRWRPSCTGRCTTS
jgi:hydroxyacylglutathione hydrolase